VYARSERHDRPPQQAVDQRKGPVGAHVAQVDRSRSAVEPLSAGVRPADAWGDGPLTDQRAPGSYQAQLLRLLHIDDADGHRVSQFWTETPRTGHDDAVLFRGVGGGITGFNLVDCALTLGSCCYRQG